MASEQKWAETTRASKRPDALRRYEEATLIRARAVTLDDFLRLGLALPPGRLTFSRGVLWYNYESMCFHRDRLGAPRTIGINGVEVVDTDFFNHSWLDETYHRILREIPSFDPICSRRERRPDYGETVIFNREQRSECLVEVDNGWGFVMLVESIHADTSCLFLQLVTLAKKRAE